MVSLAGSHRGPWIVLLVLLCVVLAGAGFVAWSLDPAHLKPRLIEAAEKATGRTLTISGDTALKLSLVPTLSIDDVALSNPAGASRPDLVKAAHVEVSFALLPLLQHRFEIDRIAVTRPDIELEIDRSGRPNWVFAPRPNPQPNAPAAETGSAGAKREPFAVSIKSIELRDGRLGWADGRSGHRYEGTIPSLSITAPVEGLMQAAGTLVYDGQTIELTGRANPPHGPAADDAAAWPVVLRLASAGASLTLDGQIAHPLRGRAYKLTVDGAIPDPTVFAAWFPRLPLRGAKGLTVHAEIGDDGGRVPKLSSLAVTARTVALDTFLQDTRLENVSLGARDTGPFQLSARLILAGGESGIAGTVGDLVWLNGGASDPVALDLEWNAASARASVRGTIQAPRRLSGVALDVAVDVPDPALVTAAAPPALRAVTLRTRLTDAPGPIPFQLASNAGDLTGDVSIVREPRLTVNAHLTSHRLDLDMLRPGPGSGQRTGPGPGAPATSAVAPPSRPSPPPAPPTATQSGTAPVFSDKPLKLARLREGDANIVFSLARTRVGGVDMGAVEGVLALKDGVLRLDPFTAGPPDRRQHAALQVNAATVPPRLHLTMDAPGVALRPVLEALDSPLIATGTADIRADLTATGDSAHALAASLDGWAGIAAEGGHVDAGLISDWLARAQKLHVGGPERSELRCFALRADARSGIVSVRPSALNTAALILEGSGEVDLTNETLALRLRPRTRIGGTGIAVPLRVTGKLGAPTAKVDLSPGGGGAGMLAGLLLGGKDIMGAAGGGDPCPAALALARGGAPAAETGPHPTTPAAGGKQ